MVGKAGREDLGLVLQTAKGPGVDYPVPVPLKIVTVRMPQLWKTAPAGHLRPEAEVRNGTFVSGGGCHVLTWRVRAAFPRKL